MGTQKNLNAKKASLSYSAKRRVTRSSRIPTRASCLPPQTSSRKQTNIVRPNKMPHFPPPTATTVPSERAEPWQEREKKLIIPLYKAGKTYAEISQLLPRRSKAAVNSKLQKISNPKLPRRSKAAVNSKSQKISKAKKQDMCSFTLERTHNEKWQVWETELLVSLRKIGKTYEEISQQLPRRSISACKAKQQDMMSHKVPKRWQAWEDDLVISLFKAVKSFGEISQQIPNRSEEDCYIRLRKLLKSGKHDLVEIPGKRWKDWEEQLIITNHQAGKSWADISKLLPSRTELAVTQRWKKHLNPIQRNDYWRQEEDQLLITLHNSQSGREDWAKIAQKIPDRSAAGCKLRWNRVLRCRPEVSNEVRFRDRWTKPEREKLVFLVNAIGPRYSEIAKKLPGRTASACRNVYHKVRAEESGTSGPSREDWLRSWDSKFVDDVSQTSLNIDHADDWMLQILRRSRKIIRKRFLLPMA